MNKWAVPYSQYFLFNTGIEDTFKLMDVVQIQ